MSYRVQILTVEGIEIGRLEREGDRGDLREAAREVSDYLLAEDELRVVEFQDSRDVEDAPDTVDFVAWVVPAHVPVAESVPAPVMAGPELGARERRRRQDWSPGEEEEPEWLIESGPWPDSAPLWLEFYNEDSGVYRFTTHEPSAMRMMRFDADRIMQILVQRNERRLQVKNEREMGS